MHIVLLTTIMAVTSLILIYKYRYLFFK
ncbi:sortase B protein-sorting domain-containing protein [cyanobacterium endosymbiont of Rhopalodia gibberula]